MMKVAVCGAWHVHAVDYTKKAVEKETGVEVLSIVTLDVIDGKVVIKKTIED